MSQKHFSFGKYHISIARLKDNVLSVRTEKKNYPMSSVVITNDVRDLLLDYKDHGKFNLSLYNKLVGNNKTIMDKLLKSSGMDDHLHIRINNDDMNQLLERYDLLRGGILAGNDSVEVRKELKNIVLQLVKMGKLPFKKSYDLLLELALLD